MVVLNIVEARPMSTLKLHGSIIGGGENRWVYRFDRFNIGAVKVGPSHGIGHGFVYGEIKDSGPSPGQGHR